MSIDLVHDEVEKKLLEERGMIQKAESFLGRILEETCEQIRKLKATLYHIDRDLENKESNLHIDRRNIALKETDFNLNTCCDTSCLAKPYVTLFMINIIQRICPTFFLAYIVVYIYKIDV